MRAHGGDHDRSGQLEVALVEVAQDGVRPFDQVRDLLHQLGIGHGASLLGSGRLEHERGHLLPALGGVRQDSVVAERRLVAARALDLEPVRRKRPVAPAPLPGPDTK